MQMTTRTTLTSVLTGALGLALLMSAACGKKNEYSGDTAAAGGAVTSAAPAANLQVADVKLGKRLGADKQVADETDTFGTRDTIYAAVHTTGFASSAQLSARWMFESGQQVDERTETISPTTDAYTEFHISKPSGWPPGKYMVHILLNGQEVQTKEFTVKK
jgi:hypothetical protein